MKFRIANNTEVEIGPGNLIKVKSGYIPTQFEGQQLEVTKIESGYPFVRFFKEEIYYDVEGIERKKISFDEESAVSPEIITEVL